MFGNNAFGALGVEPNQQAGPSRKQVQGDEIDVDVSHSLQSLDAGWTNISSGFDWSRRIMM